MNQKDMILRDLKNGAYITPLDALRDYQCMRLSGRVLELRQEGHNIQTKYDPGKKRYAVYYLAKEGE